jgi:hypothetical protein
MIYYLSTESTLMLLSVMKKKGSRCRHIYIVFPTYCVQIRESAEQRISGFSQRNSLHRTTSHRRTKFRLVPMLFYIKGKAIPVTGRGGP